MAGMPDDNGELWSRVAKASIGNKQKNGDSWLRPGDKERVSGYFGRKEYPAAYGVIKIQLKVSDE